MTPGRLQREAGAYLHVHPRERLEPCLGVHLETAEQVVSPRAQSSLPAAPRQATAKRRCTVADFERLAPGIYRFRGERFVEMWLEGGEAMVKDHGPLAESSSWGPLSALSDCTDPVLWRRRLGWSKRSPKGEGVPLCAFLCRQ